jgi:hypothetical protein
LLSSKLSFSSPNFYPHSVRTKTVSGKEKGKRKEKEKIIIEDDDYEDFEEISDFEKEKKK